jgi:hypothetical protein
MAPTWEGASYDSRSNKSKRGLHSGRILENWNTLSLHEIALRRNRKPIGDWRSSVQRQSQALDTRRNHSGFQHGIH